MTNELDVILAELEGEAGRSRRGGGPKTALGKATASQNALRHGLTSNAPTIPGETVEAWQAHRAGIVGDLAPVGALESALADRAALLLWRLHRVWRAETALVTRQMNRALEFSMLDKDPAEASVPYPNDDYVARYETHLSRQLWSTLHELEAWQRRRQGDAQPLARLEVNAPDK